MELSEDGEKWGGGGDKARQDFLQSITADSIKDLGHVYEGCILIDLRSSFLHFSCICLSTKIMSAVPLFDLSPQWLPGAFSCTIVGMSLFSKTRAKTLPAMEIRVMPR